MHRIVDCDGFTREFLEGLGISVPQPEPVPDDEFNRRREKVIYCKSNIEIWTLEVLYRNESAH